MGDMRSICSLEDTKELRGLIIENPDLPLLVFCGEEAWSGEYGYEQVCVKKVGIRELTLYREYWLDKDDYTEELTNDLCDNGEYERLSDQEFDKMVEKKVQETDFAKAIVIYVG